MKKICFLFLLGVFLFSETHAQNYNNIVNYNLNNTPVNGIKITTNLPFTTSSQMPTIFIRGYNYGGANFGGVGAIDLTVTYYIYDSGSGPQFLHYSASTAGAYNPPIQLSNEGGKVVIFINDKPYYSRFTVSAFAQGMSQDIAGNYTGWTVADAAVTGTGTVTLAYANTFSGNVTMPGTGIWNSTGNVGIGTTNTQGYKLAVNGSAIATSMIVKLYANWPDYVLKNDYVLPPLEEVKSYIDKNHHLPEIPSAGEIAKNGIDLGEMNKLLTKKVEELTLYLIKKDGQQKNLAAELKDQHDQIRQLKEQVQILIKASKKR